ncbi:MAG: potassium channel family protein [Chloroflexota bacterium]
MQYIVPKERNIMQGRVIYLLIIIFALQTFYPFTFTDELWKLITFQMGYLLMIVAGILVVQDSPKQVIILVGLGIFWGVSGLAFVLNPVTLTFLLAYISIALYQAMVAWILTLYIFTSRVVNRDVIYATICVYMLIGAVFVGIYGTIETITFSQTRMHAFADPQVAPDEIFPWQNLVYYSYVTLTTLGYGDILPVHPWARSFATLESIIGVLFTTIVIARLIGIYSSSEQKEPN